MTTIKVVAWTNYTTLLERFKIYIPRGNGNIFDNIYVFHGFVFEVCFGIISSDLIVNVLPYHVLYGQFEDRAKIE